MELLCTGVLELLFLSQDLLKSVPTILIPDSLNDSLLLNQSETQAKRSKIQISDKMGPEEVTTNIYARNDSFKVFRCRSNLNHAE